MEHLLFSRRGLSAEQCVLHIADPGRCLLFARRAIALPVCLLSSIAFFLET
jgi:hypothetical protein